MPVYTVTKSIGSASRNYSTLQTWEDAAPANLTTCEKSAATTFLTSTFTVGMSLTFVGSGATGVLLETDSTGPASGTYIVYSVATGNPAASDVVTGTGGSPPTCVLTSGTPDNLGIIWKGECYNDTEFTSAVNILLISGQTTSTTCTINLTAAVGQSFQDHANVQTNGLRYNASNGVGLRSTATYKYCIIIESTDVTVERLQFKTDQVNSSIFGTGAGGGAAAHVYQNIIADSWHTGNIGRFRKGTTVRNALLFSNAGSGPTMDYVACFYDNVTLVRDSAAGGGTALAALAAGTSVTVKNCAIFGFTTLTGLGTYGGNNNCSDLAIGFGTSNQASKTYANQFQTTTGASRDFRLKTGADCVDNGATISTSSPDIAKTTRPIGSAYDIGCWELVAAGGSFPIGARAHRYPAIARH